MIPVLLSSILILLVLIYLFVYISYKKQSLKEKNN